MLSNVTPPGRAARATGWAFSLYTATGVLALGRTLVLAALLGPREFGLFSVAFLSTVVLEKLSRTGFD